MNQNLIIPLVGLLTFLASAQITAPIARADTAAAAYIEGIEALQQANYPHAITALSDAIQADSENASYRRARGVAYTLSEQFPQALADLDRARRLDPDDTEARLWAAAAYRMSGDVMTGAATFTMRDLPHDYANLVYNLMAMQYWQSRYHGNYYDPASKQMVQANGPVKTLFPEAAKEYAQRNRATGAAAAEVITQQEKDAIAHGDWTTALRDVGQLRANAPDDMALRGDWALALLGAGNALKAREEFTRVLSINPFWTDGYVGRAQAHFMLGDSPRARSDLETASTLGAGPIAVLQTRLSKFAAPPPPDDAPAQFAATATTDVPFAQLVAAATAVQLWTNQHRDYYDQSYQLRIWLLSHAMHDRAQNTDYPEMLARFIFDYRNPPIVWNGPRGSGEQLRPQSPADLNNEVRRAIDLCNAALQIDDKQANALATKGWILFTIKAAGVDDIADRGLASDPDNVRLLDLKFTLLSNHAGDLEAQASGLRAGHTDHHTEMRSDGEYEVTTHTTPSAAELEQAAQCAAHAAELRAQAKKVQAHSQEVAGVLIPSLLKQGGDLLAKGDFPAARRALMPAYLHDPTRIDVLAPLADLCKREGNAADSQIYSLLSQPPTGTTAAPDLKATWDACIATKWTTAGEAADRAFQIDPSDARTDAYRSIIAANNDTPDPAAARRWRIAALALEEARARLSGTTLLDNNIPTPDLIDLQQSGLSMILRTQAGNADITAGHDSDAIADFAANVALEKRFDPQLRVEPVPTAMLPDPSTDAATIPAAPTLASLLGWSRLGLANAYLEAHQPSDAQAQYTALRAYLANWPATAPGRESMNVVDSWARLGQAQAAYAAHDLSRALNIVEGMEGWPPGLPADLDTPRKALADELHSQLYGQPAQQAPQQPAMQSMNASEIQNLQSEIDVIQAQRDKTADRLKDPSLSEPQRNAAQNMLDQLDQVIARQQAMIDQLKKTGP